MVDAHAPTLTSNKRAEFNSSNLNISNLDYDVNGIAKDNEWIGKTDNVLNEVNRQLVDDSLTIEDIDDIFSQLMNMTSISDAKSKVKKGFKEYQKII